MIYSYTGIMTTFFIMVGLKPILKPLLDYQNIFMLSIGLCLMFFILGAIADGVNKK